MAIFATVFLLKSIQDNSGSVSGPDAALEEIADRYFKENIQESGNTSGNYTLVIKNLKKTGFDTSGFDMYGCSDNSRVVLTINNSQESGETTYQTETTPIDCNN